VPVKNIDFYERQDTICTLRHHIYILPHPHILSTLILPLSICKRVSETSPKAPRYLPFTFPKTKDHFTNIVSNTR
jgi:hypothetical protein